MIDSSNKLRKHRAISGAKAGGEVGTVQNSTPVVKAKKARTDPSDYTPSAGRALALDQPPPAPTTIQGKSGLGFETVETPAAKGLKVPGQQASVGLDCTQAYQPGSKLPELPGLPPDLHLLQVRVNAEVERDPQKFVDLYRSAVDLIGGAPTFVPDDAKGALVPEQWFGRGGELTAEVREFRAGGANAALHQAAHAVAQLAFLQRLDEMALAQERGEPQRVLVTNGGCGAGKGFALRKGLGEEFKSAYGAIWDAAGEQSALDNKWILDEAKKRGLKVTLIYVHSDPHVAFERATTTRFESEGRLVNTRSYAESFVDGAEKMRQFVAELARAKDPNVDLVLVDNSKTGAKPTATVFSAGELDDAVRELDTHIPQNYRNVEDLMRQLTSKVPADFPDYGRRGLEILDFAD